MKFLNLNNKKKAIEKNDASQGDSSLKKQSLEVSNRKDVVKLNIGCGTDYRDGFINIDGSDTLPRIDKIIDISTESITKHFSSSSVDYILANDIVEHHYHWEAVSLLKDFYEVLKPGGICEIRVPDAEYIIKSEKFPIERKLVLLFGGQDVPQGVDQKMDESRKKFPQYFCHKYGWSMLRMNNDLSTIGFKNIYMVGADSNFITYAKK